MKYSFEDLEKFIKTYIVCANDRVISYQKLGIMHKFEVSRKTTTKSNVIKHELSPFMYIKGCDAKFHLNLFGNAKPKNRH